MRGIVERYEGMATARGHQIRVDRYPGEVVLWYLHRGEHDGVFGRHRMGLARIRKQADVYTVGPAPGHRGASRREPLVLGHQRGLRLARLGRREPLRATNGVKDRHVEGSRHMSDETGRMPEEYIDRPVPLPEELKVKDLGPEHGEVFLGVDDVAVDLDRVCWVWLDAPVFGAEFRDVAPLILRRTRDAGYEIRMGGLPNESDFTLIPTPDASTWVRVEVV
ncbi:MAG TPA: hypothetical protein VG406_16950 [Isosphaeraceae bacterium]|jgi:hypothetical protein|nr:hypothetical protein [Isosphaeraceae bacterium]